jgi:hypothetical protein
VDIAVTTTHCQKSSASLIEAQAPQLGHAVVDEGAVHRWSRVQDLIDETSNARVWAGIHYRFSTKVGEEMGRQIAEYVLRTSLLPLN